MFKLKNTCKGWARMQAAIKKKKTVYHSIRIEYEPRNNEYYELVQALNPNDPKLSPIEVEGIKNFNKNEIGEYRTPSGEVAWECLRIFIRQRLEKFPESGRPDSDAFDNEWSCEYNVYLDDDDKWNDFLTYFGEILKEIKGITGKDIYLKSESQSNAGIPKAEPLANKFAYDQYGNKFEVGDFVARSKVGTTGTFADVIIGTTEKSLALLSGGNCSPESVFVIKKGNGTPANIAY